MDAQWDSNTLHAPVHDQVNSENGVQGVMVIFIVPTGLMSQNVIYTMGWTFIVMEIVVSLEMKDQHLWVIDGTYVESGDCP